MAAVYYRFKCAIKFDSIPVFGRFISVNDLKYQIFKAKHLGGTDFDIEVFDAQTNEEYKDDASKPAMIPANTSVIIRRTPLLHKPIVLLPEGSQVKDNELESIPCMSEDASVITSSQESEFGPDIYATIEVASAQINNKNAGTRYINVADEDSKIRSLIDTPALDGNCQAQPANARGFGKGMDDRMMAGLASRKPPAGYVCHRCKTPGHYIQHCPTNQNPEYDIKRLEPSTGFPKSLSSGTSAVLEPNEAPFKKANEGSSSNCATYDVVPELHCPMCQKVMKDAVLSSKCCFASFCDKCIRDFVIKKNMCFCGAKYVIADDLLPNKALRETISRILEETTSSSTNAGSLTQLQDMQSANHTLQYSTSSLSSGVEPKYIAADHSADSKKEGAMGPEDVGIQLNPSGTEAIDGGVGVAPESKTREPKLQENVMMVKNTGEEHSAEGKDKKKKKKINKHIPENDSVIHSRSYQGFEDENVTSLTSEAVGYNQYCLPWMQSGALPYACYMPNQFGGFHPSDPYIAQGYMKYPVPPISRKKRSNSSYSMWNEEYQEDRNRRQKDEHPSGMERNKRRRREA